MLILKNASISGFYEEIINKKVYAFGFSKLLRTYRTWRAPDYILTDVIYKIVDNDCKLWGMNYFYGSYIPIISPDVMRKEIDKNDIILISSACYGEIIEQLDGYEELNGNICYILHFIDDIFDSKIDMNVFFKVQSKDFCIPPTIHYCWFGKKKIPEEYQYYISTWKKYCPEYKMICWNEENYDIDRHPYVKWAYENELWAFVSDYVRLDVLYNYGGIYLDTDVELIKNLDELRKFHAFACFESTQMVNTGLGIGSKKGHHILKMFLEEYDNLDMTGDFPKIPCTVYQTTVLRKLGLIGNNSFQCLCNNQFMVLPTEFLCGIRLRTHVRQITDNTYSLHHYSGEWGGKKVVQDAKKRREKYLGDLFHRLDLSLGSC